MATVDDILDELQTQLGLIITGTPLNGSAPNDLYEAYVWNLILQSATDENGTVTLRNAEGYLTQNLVFRRSPGKISAITNPLYTHALIEFPGDVPALEAHVGVR